MTIHSDTVKTMNNAPCIVSFLSWVFTNQYEDEFFENLWEKLKELVPLQFFQIELGNANSENAYSFSFGSMTKEKMQIVSSFLAKYDSEGYKIPLNTAIHIPLESSDIEIIAFTDNTLDVFSTMIVSTENLPFSGDHLKILQMVFSAIVMKNQRMAYIQVEQELSSIRDERRTQYNFISGITHDLRNPLGCIKGYVTTLLRTDVQWESEMQKKFLEVINSESDHLEDMITNLLETARLQSGNYELNYQNVNLQILLENLEKVNNIKDPELNIHIVSIEEEPCILADQKKLTQAFQNLVDNARKHAKILEIWFKISKGNDGFLVQCEDHGEGIAEDRLKNIFERFSRAPEFSPGNHGVGLGLYISKQIIERHQGTIRVNSIPGTGTTFSIYLPKAPTHRLGQERG